MNGKNKGHSSGTEWEAAAGQGSAATPQLLFDFLRDMIYDPKNARLDVQALDKEYRDLGKGLLYLAELVAESRTFTAALARGDLKAPIPGRDNELASSLKALHASLRHMTWQTQQVAKGDYKQRIDFMGEFSEAFNTMVEQLDARQKALEQEIEAGRQKTQALQAAGSLVTNITENISQMIVVLREDTEQVLYSNQAAQSAFAQDPELLPRLQSLPALVPGQPADARQLATRVEGQDRYYEANGYALQWEGQNAQAYVVEDVSDRRAQVRRLEKLANWDELTRLYNRHFGMEALHVWLEEKRWFTLCFLDLDNLKYINDTYGHLEGDRYICRAADMLKGFMAGSLACRLGGDEFMVLVPGVGSASVTPRLDALRENFHDGDAESRPYEASISYGVVEVLPDSGMTASVVLSLADERMYTQKRSNKRQRGITPPGKTQ